MGWKIIEVQETQEINGFLAVDGRFVTCPIFQAVKREMYWQNEIPTDQLLRGPTNYYNITIIIKQTVCTYQFLPPGDLMNTEFSALRHRSSADQKVTFYTLVNIFKSYCLLVWQ